MPPALRGDASPLSSSSAATTTTTTSSGAGIANSLEQGRQHATPSSYRDMQGSGQGRVDKQSFEYLWKSGLAGGLAACAAKTAVGPLDRVKILFQASSPQFAKYTGSWFGVVSAMRDINKQEGVRGLFRGHSATLLRIFPYGAIKFQAYEQVRAVIIPGPEHETPLRRLASGSIAGVTSVFFTYPLEVIRVRLAFETSRDKTSGRGNLSRICRKIFNEQPPAPSSSQTSSLMANGAPTASIPNTLDAVSPRHGLANFYRGFAPTLLGMVPYAGMSFLTHDTVGDWLRLRTVARYTTIDRAGKDGRPQLTHTAELASGAAAGLISQTASYPLEVVRRRMQVGGAVGDGKRLRIGETAARIWAEHGSKGFFVGLGIGYVKVVPMVAISFWTYEKGKIALGI